MLKRVKLILLLMLLFLSFSFLVSCGNKKEEENTYNLDVSQYNTKEYPLPRSVFLSKLPDYANVVSFSYYKSVYNSVLDYYLEVKFDTEEDLTSYYDLVIKGGLLALKDYTLPGNATEWYIKEQNPYNSSYTDVICLAKQDTEEYNYDYVGYRTEMLGTTKTFSSNFAVISYSYDDLTIVQSWARYQYYENLSSYIPKYFEKFGIPIMQDGFNRVYYDAMWDLENCGCEVVDLTPKMVDFMRNCVEDLRAFKKKYGKIPAMFYFHKKVNDRGDWDIKLKDEWKFEDGKIYMFLGKRMRSDDPGNICFAYIGGVLFSKETLCFGAGMNQTTKFDLNFGSTSSYFDDPRDTVMIRYGHDLYTAGIFEE